MDVLSNLMAGLEAAISPMNLLFCFIGVLLGFIVGVLPGVGAPGAIGMMIPFVAQGTPTESLILMAGIYYGALYGGASTAVLINVPGENASIVTAFDGYPLARQGKAGKALSMAALGSLFGGTFSVIGLTILAPVVAEFALRFGPPELFGLVFLGLITIAWLAEKAMVKALLMACLGLLISTMGTDVVTGQARFDFGLPELLDGIPFVIAAVGLFAVGEVLYNLYDPTPQGQVSDRTSLKQALPSLREMASCIPTMFRCAALGFFVGTLPGAGATVSAFLAYGMEKRLAKDPDRFGQGAVEGVVAAQAADNGSTGGAFVPLFTLGIPGSASTAMLAGALIMFGLQPGPDLMVEQPRFVWTVIGSMYVGNIMLALLSLGIIPILTWLMRIRYEWLYPLIIVLCLIGTYALRNQAFDVALLVLFGILGFLFRKGGYPPAPLVLALVLGPLLERALRRTLIMSGGDVTMLFTRPISATLIIIALLGLAIALWQRRQQETAERRERQTAGGK